MSEKLFKSVSSYIDENYIRSKKIDEYGTDNMEEYRQSARRRREEFIMAEHKEAMDSNELGNLLKELDAGFSETLLKLIDRTGKKDSEIYKKANIDRKLFSKIKNNLDYKPSKPTAIAFALALELDIDETRDFIGRAGFAFSHSSKFDVIVEYFLINKNYNIFELNEVLFAFDQPLICA